VREKRGLCSCRWPRARAAPRCAPTAPLSATSRPRSQPRASSASAGAFPRALGSTVPRCERGTDLGDASRKGCVAQRRASGAIGVGSGEGGAGDGVAGDGVAGGRLGCGCTDRGGLRFAVPRRAGGGGRAGARLPAPTSLHSARQHTLNQRMVIQAGSRPRCGPPAGGHTRAGGAAQPSPCLWIPRRRLVAAPAPPLRSSQVALRLGTATSRTRPRPQGAQRLTASAHAAGHRHHSSVPACGCPPPPVSPAARHHKAPPGPAGRPCTGAPLAQPPRSVRQISRGPLVRTAARRPATCRPGAGQSRAGDAGNAGRASPERPWSMMVRLPCHKAGSPQRAELASACMHGIWTATTSVATFLGSAPPPPALPTAPSAAAAAALAAATAPWWSALRH
jgi:hypothetical protein